MPASVYLVFGTDDYLVTAKAKEIAAQLLPGAQQDVGLETVPARHDSAAAAAAAVGECLAALRTTSLFGGNKLVWLRDADFLGEGIPAGPAGDPLRDRLRDLIQAIASGLPAGHALLVTAAGVDKRTAFYKACEKHGQCCEFSVAEKAWEAEKQAADRLEGLLAASTLKMSQDVRCQFLEKVGGDTRDLASELEKLSAYLGERRDVRAQDVEAVTSSSRSIKSWDLADAVGRRNLPVALEHLKQLFFQQESVIGIVVVLERRFRELMIYREALDRGWAEVREERGRRTASWNALDPALSAALTEQLGKDPAKIHPYRLLLLLEQARAFPRRRLVACQRYLLEAHARLVSTSLPEESVLETLLVRMLA